MQEGAIWTAPSCFFRHDMLYYPYKRINTDHTVIIVYRTRSMDSAVR